MATFSFRRFTGVCFFNLVVSFLLHISCLLFSPKVWRFKSSSGLVVIGLQPFVLELSWPSKSLSTSSSSSSYSECDSYLGFYTTFIFSSRMSRNTSFHLWYFPFKPHTLCRFIQITLSISAVFGSFAGWKFKGPELNFRWITFSVSVFTVCYVPSIAVCILFWNLLSI